MSPSTSSRSSSSTVMLELSGYYTYYKYNLFRRAAYIPQFSMIINEHDQTIRGSGDDLHGSYIIAGTLVGSDIRFIKRYVGLKSTKIKALKFVGKRLESLGGSGSFYQFVGAWGKRNWQGGQWMFSTHVDSNEDSGVRHPIEGHWAGTYQHATKSSSPRQDIPISISIHLGPPSQAPPSPSSTEKASSQASTGNTIKGLGRDASGSFTIEGTISEDGEVEFSKASGDGSKWSWKYQGEYQEEGAINGIWQETKDEKNIVKGAFEVTKTSVVPVELAKGVMMSVGMMPYSVSEDEGVRKAVEVVRRATSKTQIEPEAFDMLLEGFRWRGLCGRLRSKYPTVCCCCCCLC